MIECIFIGGPLHCETAWLESADKLLWRPMSQGQVAAYGFREWAEGSASAYYAPIGFSEFQFRRCLDEYVGRDP